LRAHEFDAALVVAVYRESVVAKQQEYDGRIARNMAGHLH